MNQKLQNNFQKLIFNPLFMIPNSQHVPVLLRETIEVLDPKPGEFFIDGTLDGGGHASAILEKMAPRGKFLGIDWDKNILETARVQIESRFQIPNPDFQPFWVNENFANLPEILEKNGLGKADGLLLDLGMSSEQLENSGRGFSLKKDEPLLMTYDINAKPVKQILEELSESELAEIIKKYSEERFSGRIARAIKEREKINPIETSSQLAELIKQSVPKNYERGRLHPATRAFMALRIYANHELENLERILKNLRRVLKSGGRVAIISFHSLEDRLVKNEFRDLVKTDGLRLINKKPIRPAREEIANNPRSRSAKLRAATALS